jgi:hypothetical protein
MKNSEAAEQRDAAREHRDDRRAAPAQRVAAQDREDEQEQGAAQQRDAGPVDRARRDRR